MKAEIELKKSIRGKKYYLIVDNIFIIKISKKQYQLLLILFKWREQKDENETI